MLNAARAASKCRGNGSCNLFKYTVSFDFQSDEVASGRELPEEMPDARPAIAAPQASAKPIKVAATAFLNGDSRYILNYNTQYVEITTQSSVTHLSVELRLDKES